MGAVRWRERRGTTQYESQTVDTTRSTMRSGQELNTVAQTYCGKIYCIVLEEAGTCSEKKEKANEK